MDLRRGITIKITAALALFIVLILAFLSFDQQFAELFDQPEYFGFKKFCREITDIAEGSYYIYLAAAAYLGSRVILPWMTWMKNRPDVLRRIRERSGFALASFVFVGLLNLVLKFAVGRQRPHRSETFENLVFDPFSFHWHWQSFPSGHSLIIFVAATLGSIFWPKLKWPFFIFALFIAFTRVVIHQHFFSDVIFGAFLGVAGTIFLYSKVKNRFLYL